jgi:hypothetical protein
MSMRSFVLPAGQQALLDYLAQLPIEKRFTVTIEPYRKKRSIDANAFYWSQVVTPFAAHLGYSPEELHTEICGSYFGWKKIEFRGHKREVPRRTTTTPDTLGTMDFADFIAHAQSIAAEMGCPVDIAA